MKLQIRSFASFQVLRELEVSSYSLCCDSVDSVGSTVNIVGTDIPRTDAGNWVIAAGRLYYLDTVTPQAPQTILTLLNPLDAFARMLLYVPDVNVVTIGDYIASVIQREWIAQTDGVYAIPYLEIQNLDTVTTFQPPELDKDGLYSLADYVRTMRRRHSVVCAFSPTRSGIRLTISIEAHSHRVITFKDGHSMLESAAYSSSGVAKITTILPVAVIIGYDDRDRPIVQLDAAGETVYNKVVQQWYLGADGSVSESVPAVRASGKWTTLALSPNSDPMQKALDKFAKNTESHKIEFWSDYEFNVLDPCTIKLYGELLVSSISYKGRRSTNGRWFYRSGELATRASEKIMKGAIT